MDQPSSETRDCSTLPRDSSKRPAECRRVTRRNRGRALPTYRRECRNTRAFERCFAWTQRRWIDTRPNSTCWCMAECCEAKYVARGKHQQPSNKARTSSSSGNTQIFFAHRRTLDNTLIAARRTNHTNILAVRQPRITVAHRTRDHIVDGGNSLPCVLARK